MMHNSVRAVHNTIAAINQREKSMVFFVRHQESLRGPNVRQNLAIVKRAATKRHNPVSDATEIGQLEPVRSLTIHAESPSGPPVSPITK